MSHPIHEHCDSHRQGLKEAMDEMKIFLMISIIKLSMGKWQAEKRQFTAQAEES
ncbi:hypothetical protein M378DRAFT_160300 [Amanita muscaria Koide BX008]|uniref:Uncharacterized protein n=1 Tax=Amanita muscaria (strain Koide BX008) TaxID=946122 RepID=A0A0C2XBQ9_AMAMK|nr:hypothetical protein M378DRAFT_160300 [Amanita muscaria Koide BX008]